jgi:hypothetical protein
VRKSPFILIPLGVVAALCILGASFWALLLAAGPQTRALRDGSRLLLADVTYGRQHVLVERTAWQRLLGSVLPPRFQPSNSWSWSDSQQPELAFLVVQEGARSDSAWSGEAVAIDEHGCPFGRPGRTVLPAPIISPRFEAVGTLEVFPRREDGFRLQLRGPPASPPDAVFGIDNPAPGPYPVWSSSPLPAKQQLGDLQVTLSGLTTGLTWEQLLQSHPRLPARAVAGFLAKEARYWSGSPTDPPAHAAPWTRVSLRVIQQGRPASDWSVEGVTISDATGNRLHHRTSDPYQCLSSGLDSQGRCWIAFQSALCLRESAWKVAVHLPYTGPEAADRADLRWTVPHVPLPPPGTDTPHTAATRQGVTLRLRGVYSPGAPWPDGTRGPLRVTRARVEIHRPPGERWRLCLRATDTAGRGLSPASQITFRGTEREWWPELKIPRGLTHVNLSFTGWRERTPAFLARPVDARE